MQCFWEMQWKLLLAGEILKKMSENMKMFMEK